MNAGWNSISTVQQQQFLSKAGLSTLPELSALDASQWNMLAGIVGEAAVQELRQTVAGTISEPSLDLPKDMGDWSDIMMKVAEMRLKLSELQQKTSTEDIKAQKDRMAETNKLEAEKIRESLDKLEKASKSGLLGKIFGWIGALVAVIGAAIATAVTAGAAAPVLAVAVIGLGVMILQETGAMEKIMDFLAENPAMLFLIFHPVLAATLFGLSEGGVMDKDQLKMTLQITLGVAMLAASVAGMVLSGGATASNAALQIAGIVGQIIGAASSVGSGASGIAQSAYSYQAAEIQADVQENKAWLAKLQQMLSEEMDRLQEIIDRLNSEVGDASDLLGDIASSNRAVISNMGM